MVTCIDHGSSHIRFQRALLEEEARLTGLAPAMPHPSIIEKEMREYEEADMIAIPSTYVKKSFIAQGVPTEKLAQVPYGVDLDAFVPGEKDDDTFRVIYAGGMTLQKGVHYLLQAFADLNLPRAELLLVGGGNGELDPYFKKYKGTFTWVGGIPQRALIRRYQQSSVFVLNSIDDGFGMVMAEAMSSGLPVIATDHTGASDLFEDGKEGFIIPIRDPEALSRKLKYLYDHEEERRNMGTRAIGRVRQGYSWREYGDRMVRAYENAIMKKQGHL